MNYRFSVEKQTLDKLLSLAPGGQWKLYDLFVLIARQPHAEADLFLSESAAISVSVRVFGPLLVHYHVDHAMRQVQILDFEIIGEGAR